MNYRTLTLTSREDMQNFVENIDDDILLLLFIVFRGRFPYLRLITYILITVFSFCDINVDSEGLKFSCNKHNNVFTVLL